MFQAAIPLLGWTWIFNKRLPKRLIQLHHLISMSVFKPILYISILHSLLLYYIQIISLKEYDLLNPILKAIPVKIVFCYLILIFLLKMIGFFREWHLKTTASKELLKKYSFFLLLDHLRNGMLYQHAKYYWWQKNINMNISKKCNPFFL